MSRQQAITHVQMLLNGERTFRCEWLLRLLVIRTRATMPGSAPRSSQERQPRQW